MLNLMEILADVLEMKCGDGRKEVWNKTAFPSSFHFVHFSELMNKITTD
jgi:hypothetical protein